MSLKHALLGYLSFYDMSGYDLKKALDASVEHFWHADQSQIYRTLRQLRKEGFVVQEVIEREDRLDRKVYSITEDGRQEIHRWLTTPLEPGDEHDPFLIQIYFGGMISDNALLHLLRTQLAYAEEQTAIFNAINQMVLGQYHNSESKRTVFCTLLTLEHGAFLARATRQWLQSAVERIENQVYQPLNIAEILSFESNETNK
jgi:PadR family transcriptional regulator, regulatory protein AphA